MKKNGIPIFPDSKTYFTSYAFGNFTFDENDNVNGIIASLGSVRFKYKKID